MTGIDSYPLLEEPGACRMGGVGRGQGSWPPSCPPWSPVSLRMVAAELLGGAHLVLGPEGGGRWAQVPSPAHMARSRTGAPSLALASLSRARPEPPPPQAYEGVLQLVEAVGALRGAVHRHVRHPRHHQQQRARH